MKTIRILSYYLLLFIYHSGGSKRKYHSIDSRKSIPELNITALKLNKGKDKPSPFLFTFNFPNNLSFNIFAE